MTEEERIEAAETPASEAAGSLPAEERDSQDAELEQLKAEKADLEDRLARAQAELVNYRRRAQNEIEQFRRYEGLNLIRDVLPTIDNLQRATAAAEQSQDIQNLKMGVEMVSRQLVEALQRNRIEVIPTQGEVFDPNMHEALQQAPSEEVPPMHILAELETGYKMLDRIVRPAKVIVSTGPAATADASESRDN